MRRREKTKTIIVALRINGVKNGRIRGKHNARIAVIFICNKVAKRCIGKIVLIAALRLTNKCNSIGEKKNILNVTGPHKNIYQGRGDARLSRTGCHNKQTLAMARFYIGAYSLYCLYLVVTASTACYGLVNRKGRWLLNVASTVDDLLQIILREYAANLSHWSGVIIDKEGFKSVGKDNGRLVAILHFKALSV